MPGPVTWAWAALLASPPPTKTVHAERAREAVLVDGRLDDEVWHRAEVRRDFIERTPRLEQDPDPDIQFQVAYDELNLYVFVRIRGYDHRPRIRTLRRDSGGIFADDWLALKIDPQRDRRTTYAFSINASGAQNDTLALDDGRNNLRQWDGVWEAETVVHDDGYDAEFSIPFYVLGLRGRGEERTLGFNVSVGDTSTNANIDWSLIMPPLSGLASSRHGDLKGLQGIRSSRALELLPFALSRTDFSERLSVDPRARPNFAAGGDARLQIGTGSYVEATVLTDFAQVEADQVQVARDRFPLFFPERRPFFINGLDAFNFGQSQEAQLFFSRRIGLSGGQPIPVGAGAKVYGRSPKVTYALLNVQTLRTRPVLEDDEEIPPENYSVGRVRGQIGRYFSLGAIGMAQARFAETGHDHVSGGLDGEVRAFRGQLRVYGFGAASWSEVAATAAVLDDDTGDELAPAMAERQEVGASGYGVVDYRGLYVRPRVSWLYSDGRFDPKMGFYRRPGTALHNAQLDFAPRPAVLGIEDVVFGPRVSLVSDPGYASLLTQRVSGRVRINWNSGSSIEYQVQTFADEVQEDFELYQYTVEADRYLGLRHQARVQSPRRLPVSGELNYQYIDLFGGRAHQPGAQLTLRPSRHFQTSIRYDQLIGTLGPGQDFNFGFGNASAEVAFNRNLVLDSLFRLSLEPGVERLGVQTRLRWRYRPGSDFFVVYRTDQPFGPDSAGNPRDPFHEVIFKVAVYMRALLGGGPT